MIAFLVAAGFATLAAPQRSAGAGPPARLYAAMTHDSSRGRIVLFGGAASNSLSPQVLGDLWEWDGTSWSRSPAGGPVARGSAALAFDELHRVAVLYGGYAPGTSAGRETWHYDGSKWALVSMVFLGAPFWHAMAFDSARGVTVLHGGFNTRPNPEWSDTWEWDGRAWQWRTDEGPHYEAGHAMAYDRARAETVLAGGGRSETWTWDGALWVLAATSGPSARVFPAMTYDAARGVVVLFGGNIDPPPSVNPLGDTWEWDGDAWAPRHVPGPAARFGHSMAYDAQRCVSVLFGGVTLVGVSSETWEWDGVVWVLREDPCYPDCDTSTGRRVLDVFDFLCFQNRYTAGAAYACDCDTTTGPGLCDIFDFLCFQNEFASGCE